MKVRRIESDLNAYQYQPGDQLSDMPDWIRNHQGKYSPVLGNAPVFIDLTKSLMIPARDRFERVNYMEWVVEEDGQLKGFSEKQFKALFYLQDEPETGASESEPETGASEEETA